MQSELTAHRVHINLPEFPLAYYLYLPFNMSGQPLYRRWKHVESRLHGRGPGNLHSAATGPESATNVSIVHQYFAARSDGAWPIGTRGRRGR